MNATHVFATATESDRAVNGLVSMMFARDHDTGLHLDAVGFLSRKLAQTLDYPEDVVERIEKAGRLHDVGKSCLDLAIIRKPMSLTNEEWAEIQKHPGHGARLIHGFDALEGLADIVRWHHERLDGQGYPDGLVGDAIPFESRIVAITDAFHAMTVSRPYTRPRNPMEALIEIKRCSGTQFEPDFVDAFMEMMGSGRPYRQVTISDDIDDLFSIRQVG